MVDEEPSGVSTPDTLPQSGSTTPTVLDDVPPIKINGAQLGL